MLRMTLILCVGMYAALMIAGVDRGQMRPGLAEAAARAAQTGANDIGGPGLAAAPAVEQTVTVAAAEPVAKPVAKPVVAPLAAAPAAYVEPDRKLVTAVEEPVFTLAAVGNEAVPASPAPAETAPADTTPAKTPVPEVADGGQGTIWYVNASSVNVRAEPSTDAEIVGRLGSGEATLLVQAVDGDWARIVIQGDGVEGFVAMRYLSAEAP